jgi:hypothetical protein
MKKLDHRHLAEGEVTGHFHEAVGDGVAVLSDDGKTPKVLDAPNGADITHQEHGNITVPPGQYERVLVREYDHAEEEARDVRD